MQMSNNMSVGDNSPTYNAWQVEVLVKAGTEAMERASMIDEMSPATVLSAAFTILERTLRALRKLQASEDAASNTKEISRVLQTFLVDYGSLPN